MAVYDIKISGAQNDKIAQMMGSGKSSFSRLVTTQASVLYHIFSSRVFRISSWKIEAIFDVTFTSYDFLPTHTQSELTSLYLDVESTTTTRSNSTGRHPTPIDRLINILLTRQYSDTLVSRTTQNTKVCFDFRFCSKVTDT